jgi:hypothetical protein
MLHTVEEQTKYTYMHALQHPSLVCKFVPMAELNVFCCVMHMSVCLHVSALSSLSLMMWQFLFRCIYEQNLCLAVMD